MDSQESKPKKLSKRDNFRKKMLRRRNHISSSSDSCSSDNHNIKYKKSKNRDTSRLKTKIHSTKHKHGKRKNRSSSSDSSSSVDSSTSSTESSLLSSTSEEERKRRIKHKKKLLKRKKSKKPSIPPKIKENINDVPSNDIPVELMTEVRSMAPMTKEEWEKKQSIVKRVYDESTGRNRLIKGDGEVIEEIVSKDRHKQINQQATKGDAEYFQKKLKQL